MDLPSLSVAPLRKAPTSASYLLLILCACSVMVEYTEHCDAGSCSADLDTCSLSSPRRRARRDAARPCPVGATNTVVRRAGQGIVSPIRGLEVQHTQRRSV